MHADLQLHDRALRPAVLSPVQAFAAVAAIIGAVFAVHWPTAAAMVEIWHRSETFTHGFLVVPAVLAFVWMRRNVLAAIPVRPAPLALFGVVAGGALWLLGELSSSLAPAQLGMVAIVPFAVAALFGWAWLRTLAFPLAFLFFAVPFGEFMVPTLIEWTADFTVAAISASGVPVYREATNFVIPSGRWSVVEACSGIRYLIASVMLGSLYAWIVYRSPRRRLLFIMASILVPIVANWLRAYGIVMLGHLSNNRIATGVDHLIYGWVFFGALMLVMFAVGTRWREDGDPAPLPPIVPAAAVPRGSLATPLLLTTLAVLVWPMAAAALTRHADLRPLPAIAVTAANGWSQTSGDLPGGWRPDVAGAAQTHVLMFERGGQQAGFVIALFRNQRQGAELVSSTNQLVHQDNPRWRIVDRRSVGLEGADGTLRTQAALIRGNGVELAAAPWYWLGTQRSASDTVAKLDLALDRLLMRGDTSAWVIVVVPARDGLRPALPEIAGFVTDMGPRIDAALREMAER